MEPMGKPIDLRGTTDGEFFLVQCDGGESLQVTIEFRGADVPGFVELDARCRECGGEASLKLSGWLPGVFARRGP